MEEKYRSLLELDHNESMEFFLQNKSYVNFDLPNYFDFESLLKFLKNKLIDKNYSGLNFKKAKNLYGVNYKIYSNKNGEYEWRKFEIVNPVFYVELVKLITKENNWNYIKEKLKLFRSNKLISSYGIPVQSLDKKTNKEVQILNWWENIEQESIKLSLEFDYMFNLDVSNFYPSIYTHTIPWALHGVTISKNNTSCEKLLGNQIDCLIRYMNNNQTNGIPQGNLLSDFISEILLGYFDYILSIKLRRQKDYKILRYRDDIRIFTNNTQFGKSIIKDISLILSKLNLKINTSKTYTSDNIIKDSIKPGKLEWITSLKSEKTIQKKLLQIYILNEKFKNSGIIKTVLSQFYKELNKIIIRNNKSIKEDKIVLISILIDISLKSPNCIPLTYSCISLILTNIKSNEYDLIIKQIKNKINNYPNSEFNNIWLHRILKKEFESSEKLIKYVYNNEQIWNFEWIEESLKRQIISKKYFNEEIFNSLPDYITEEEVILFKNYY